MLLNNNHIRGIFKYSESIYFEKDDFVVDGNCIYICKGGESGNPIQGKQPSLDTEHIYYSEYPGDKIVSADEYYSYLKSVDRGEQVEDKYVSAHSLCEILENMYFGFGDNGIVYDHVLYNPGTGIEYCIRGVREVLDYSTPRVLDKIIKETSLGNGLLKVSRNLPEIRDLVMDSSGSESDVVILKQYTYLDSEGLIPFRVQELLDPEKNNIYFRFAKGESLEDGGYSFENTTVSIWRNLYSSDEEVLEKLNSLEAYYQQKIQESEDMVARMSGKYCYRDVVPTEFNQLGQNVVYLRAGSTRDIKSRESFHTSPCLLNILIKTSTSESGVFRNYSTVIDAKDACDAPGNIEIYSLQDGITLTSSYDNTQTIPTITLETSEGVIKNIYYRDYTLGHVHDWVQTIISNPTCTEPGEYQYVCSDPTCLEERVEIVDPLGHRLSHTDRIEPTCISPGSIEYWKCDRCGKCFYDEEANTEITDLNEIIIQPLGNNHSWGGWQQIQQATCTNPGVERRTCSICHTSETRPISALGHDMRLESEQEETCGDFGVNEHYHCNRCNKDFDDMSGSHQLSSEDLLIYPTGAHIFSGSGDNQNIEVLRESDYSDSPNIQTPRPTHGIGLKTCLECGNKIEVQLPFKKHVFNQDAEISGCNAFYSDGLHYPSYTRGICIECGEIRRNYNWNEDIPIDRQLENHAVVNLGSSSMEDLMSLPNYVPATCDEYGYWKGSCSLCGATDVKQFNWEDPSTGHIIQNRERWIPNDCTHDALWAGTCSECGNQGTEIDHEHLMIGHKVDSNNVCESCHQNLNN